MEKVDSHTQTVQDWYEAEKKYDLRFNYNLNSDSVVFDVGAYDGSWSKEINRRYECVVHAFEPTSEGFEKAYNNLNSVSNIYLHNYALKSFNGYADIFFNTNGSSFHNEFNLTERVQVKSIVDIIKNLDFNFIDLIKLNIEGDEYEVLEALINMNMLENFNNLQIQFHRDVPNYKLRRKDIHNYLLKSHKMTYNFEFVWESWSKV